MITGIRIVVCILKCVVQSIPIVGPLFYIRRNVQILIPIVTRTTKDFSSAIQSLCKDISFTCTLCYDIGELSEEYPVVVVCQVSSRLEPDIDLAINRVTCERFAVLLLHTGLKSSLTNVSTSIRLVNINRYHNVEFIDVAYNMDSKLYKCEMNDSAKFQLQAFFESFYGTSVSEHINPLRRLGGLIRSFFIQVLRRIIG
ncbi:uncharacterized protein LOC132717663 [Ruditapes philippinarum]|uniref:uncharacterized protein LOC132717663 n=1 Tax=Ruditapes philippinarum TaxID=129788 RepID=UPI00295AAFC1|nr:uncharacterized protein LOC132717663 [Ruditapes philippinarum]